MIRIANNSRPIKRYEVAVATRNPRLRYQIIELLDRLNLKYAVCAPDDSECEYAKVIVTTEDEKSGFDETSLVIVGSNTDDEMTTLLLMMYIIT